MHSLQILRALVLGIGLLLSPNLGQCKVNSAHTEGEARSSPADSKEPSKWGAEGSLGGHLSFPGRELQRTTDPVGLGVHLFAGATYAELPFIVGLKFGWTDFLPRLGTYTFGGEENYWELQRQTLWIGPAVRLLPRTWPFRPYVEASIGGWFHWIDLSAEDDFNPGEFDEGEKRSNTATGMWGLGAGVAWNIGKLLAMELSFDYQRGRSTQMPAVSSQNGVLVFSTIRSNEIEQWSFGLGLGARF